MSEVTDCSPGSGSKPSRVAAVILAAGRSARMGSPKALLTFGGKTAAARLVQTLRAGGAGGVFMVHGPDPAVAAHAALLPAVCIMNDAPELGRTRSLQLAIQAVCAADPPFHAILLHPVDAPLVRVETIQQILALRPAPLLVRACQGGRGGHPVLVQAPLFSELLSLDAREPLRNFIHRDPARRLDLETGDAGCLDNINTPEDYEQLRSRHPDMI